MDCVRGNEDAILRIQDVAIEWMTSTDAAFASLDALLDLRPENGEHEVVLAFRKLTHEQYSSLVKHRTPSIARAMEALSNALVGVGQVGSAVDSDSPPFHLRTKHPHRVLEILLAMIPKELHSKLTITTRPAAISVSEVLYPRN